MTHSRRLLSSWVWMCIYIYYIWRSQGRASYYISIVKPARCTNVCNLFYFILEWHSTCFGRSLRPSPAVEDCTYCNRHLSNRYSCLLADIQTAVSVTVRLDTVSHVTARNMGHVAIQHRLYLCQFMSLTSVVLMDSHSATQLPCCLLHQLYRKGVLFSLTV